MLLSRGTAMKRRAKAGGKADKVRSRTASVPKGATRPEAVPGRHSAKTGKEAEAAGLVNEAVPAARLEDRVTEVAQKLLKKNWETLKATKDAIRRVREMTYDNAQDYLIRAQEALNWHDKSDGRHRGMQQFLDDKTYKPGLSEYDKSK